MYRTTTANIRQLRNGLAELPQMHTEPIDDEKLYHPSSFSCYTTISCNTTILNCLHKRVDIETGQLHKNNTHLVIFLYPLGLKKSGCFCGDWKICGGNCIITGESRRVGALCIDTLYEASGGWNREDIK